MTKYAKNLIGDWETEQFEPLREVAQNKYQANWDKLSSDFANLNEQLAHNFQRARVKHNSAVLDNARNSFNRMYNVEQDLANRGLTGSGLINVYNAMNTQQQGQENNAALQELMDANKANIEGRFTALDSLAQGMGDLSSRLGDELAGITDAEGDNGRRYADLVADLSESAAARAAQYGTSSKEEEVDRIYQLITIKDILNDPDSDENTKYYELTVDADVSPEQAKQILSSYNYNKTNDKLKTAQDEIAKANKTQDYYKNLKPWQLGVIMSNPVSSLTGLSALGLSRLKENNTNKKVKELEKDLSQYTYEDLKNIMGYKGF